MSLPSVNLTELDGALGSLASSGDKLLVVVGASSAGTANAPAAYGRITDLVAAMGKGPMPELAAHHIRRRGRVVVVKTGATVAGTATAVTQVGTGTIVATIAASPAPNDDYEVVIKVVTGGTRGSAGITYQVSYDGGRNFGPVTALGTDVAITLTEAGTLVVNLAAGTFLAGDTISFRTTAARWNDAEITAALLALQNAVISWDVVAIAGAIDANAFDAIDTAVRAMRTVGKHRMWIGSARMPTIGESEATYKTALDAIFASKASTCGVVCAGAVKHTSAISGRKYKRPVAFVAASLEQGSAEHIDTAAIDLGPIDSISIKDSNGNPDEHDEVVSPGLDDSRFYVLRTWDGVQGTYVNLPRIFSATGSDFRLVPHRRVMNLANEALLQYLQRRLHKPVRVDRVTGFIREEDALQIEAGARAVLASVLLTTPKASAASFVLSRTDNILSTRTLTGQARVIPLGYPETITAEIGFTNPALQVQTA